MTQVSIYGFAPSTYTQTALLVCAESGVDARLEGLAFKEPSHFQLHPHGKMPVLRHGDVTLYETLAITSYVDQLFGNQALQPADAVERGRMLQWVSAAVDYLYRDLVSALHEDPPAEAVAAAGAQLKLIDRALTGQDFLAGAKLSLADFFVAPMVNFAIGKLGDGVMEGLPALRRWRAAIAARPSARKVG